MAQPSIWSEGNDVLVSLTGVRSSTMASTSYLNSSTGVRVTIWDAPTTLGSPFLSNRQLNYVAGTNGIYRTVIQSTESTAFARGDAGLAIFTLNHSGLNAKWWLHFRVDIRQSTA